MKFEIDQVLGLQNHRSGNRPKGLVTKLMKSSVNSVLFSLKDSYSHITQNKGQLGEVLSRN